MPWHGFKRKEIAADMKFHSVSRKWGGTNKANLSCDARPVLAGAVPDIALID
jgi:hypothetical protein